VCWKALADKGVQGTELRWFESFLSNRTQQVKVGEGVSSVCQVISGVIQGSVCGPVLYSVLADSLLRQVQLPAVSYADDFKIIADVTAHGLVVVQREIDTVVKWSDEHNMPLSTDKCSVLHCGPHQPLNNYFIKSHQMASVDQLKDLGVTRSSSGYYVGHCEAVVSKASRAAGAIRRAFQLRSPKLLWPAFQSYVIPILMYASAAWNPYLAKDCNALEAVQRRFTKRIHGLEHMSYESRLEHLNAMSLQKRRVYADMILAYKATHGLLHVEASDLGLNVLQSKTRGDGSHLVQRRGNSQATSALYCCRAPATWNKLPGTITCSKSFFGFKRTLRNHLFN
jgi:hypothetical protein